MMNLIRGDDSTEAHAPAPPASSGCTAAAAEPLPAVAAVLGGVKPTCGTSKQTLNLTEHIGGFSSSDRRAFSLRKQAAA